MTAYIVLKHYPLSGAQDGFTITFTEAQAQLEAQDRSVVAVRGGEQLTEGQLLEALRLPRANSIGQLLAAQVAGSQTRFIAEMNSEAGALGMDHTIYSDPSGTDPGAVSTAADQLRVFQQAMRFPVVRQTVSMASATLPVAGPLTNYNPMIAGGYAGKTGSDAAWGGCLAFVTHVTIGRAPAHRGRRGAGEGAEEETLAAVTTRCYSLPAATDVNRNHYSREKR
jgi:D-alanyl-D-alanine carboxypeptidase (penicillin-binding protein 5/6)